MKETDCFVKQVNRIIDDTIKIINHEPMNNTKAEKKSARIASPWVQYVHKLTALFGKDPEIHIEYDNEHCVVIMRVDDQAKADAIRKLLPLTKDFGNVTLTINVIPGNVATSKSSLYCTAFSGNPALSFIKDVEGVFSNPITYVVFAKEVVQFPNDDLGDVYGNCTTLYQDLAKELFEEKDGVFFCTNNKVSD